MLIFLTLTAPVVIRYSVTGQRGKAAIISIEHRYINTNGIRLHVAEAGDPAGPLVILLHGFPEFWYSWRKQIPALAKAGLRVLAPDLRGYNLSDKPGGLAAYAIDVVADDIAGLIAAVGRNSAVVVGHDWGGMVAWMLAMRRPELVSRLAVLNTPHPAQFARRLSSSPRQMVRSSYMLVFQVPSLPERLFRAGDYALARRVFRYDPARVDAFSAIDLERYVDAWGQPGALTGGLNYYRAAARFGGKAILHSMQRVDQPVLVIWGDRDRYLLSNLAEPDPALVPDAEVVHISHASHWVQHDEPDEINRMLIDFALGNGSSGGVAPRCQP